MNRLDRFNSNIEKIKDKFNNNIILIDNRDYFKSKDKVEWLCLNHNHVFNASIHTLVNKRNTCGCPICKHEKLYISSIKGVEARKKLKDDIESYSIPTEFNDDLIEWF